MKILEKEMEDLIASNPLKYLEESDLKVISRQYSIGSYRFDLLFEDRHGAKLIVEIQRGTLDRNHTYKILDYYDEFKGKHPAEFVELMVVANQIPRERRERLASKGISFREIPESMFLVDLNQDRRKETVDIIETEHVVLIENPVNNLSIDHSLLSSIRKLQPKAEYLKYLDSIEKIDFIENVNSLLCGDFLEIVRIFNKKEITYTCGNKFACIVPQREKIVVGPLLVKFEELHDPKNLCRDISKKTYASGGEIRADFAKPYLDADYAVFLIRQSLAKIA